MRAALVVGLVASLAVLAGGPAAAQPAPTRISPPASEIQLQSELNMMRAQMDALRQQQIGVNNELNARDAQVQTERNLGLLRSLSVPRYAPPAPPQDAATPAAPVDMGPYISIPDDKLAASNARVKAAAGERP